MFQKTKLRPKALLSIVSLLIAVPILLLGFQNCGQFSVSETFSKLSASCSAKIQEQAPTLAKLLSTTPPDCESPKNYVCLVRTFSPDVQNSTGESIKCVDEGTANCVQVTEISFDTRAAKKSTYDAKEFAPGGEYNRVEAQCSHSLRYSGASLFVGLGDDLGSALASAKLKCKSSNASLAKGDAP